MFRLLTRQPSEPSAKSPFVFVDAANVLTLIDRELQLVEPHEKHLDELLAACHHPLTRKEMPAQAKTTRDSLLSFLAQSPCGRAQPDPARQIAPGYTFWMRFRPQTNDPPPPIAIAGSISLRLGHNQNLDYYLGHIGYHVLPPARGRHFAQRACQLLLPLARLHGHKHLWITCNPDNLASRRTCEHLGAVFFETVNVPREKALYSQGDRQKCRYRLDL